MHGISEVFQVAERVTSGSRVISSANERSLAIIHLTGLSNGKNLRHSKQDG